MALGHEVRILSIVELSFAKDGCDYFTAPWGEERKEMEGVEVFRTYMRAMPKAVRHNANRWTQLCKKAVERYVRRFGKPDVLHVHCCNRAGLAAKEISRRLGIPYYISEHISSGLFEREFGKGWQRQTWLKDKMRQAYEAASCVIPVSRELVDDLAPFFGKSYRWHEVSNIVDTDFFTYRDREPLAGRSFRFCCLAVADIHGKGYDILADAMQHLSADVELNIAGNGTDAEPMRRLFARYSCVHLHGELNKNDVRDLLWKSDALVLPSRSEAQPLVLLEALATGIPVVGTECVPASLRIPQASLIAPVGDARMLAEKMQDAMHVQPSRKFSEAVRQLASPSIVAKQLTELFKA